MVGSLVRQVVLTAFDVFFLVAAIPAWFDKRPYLNETSVGDRVVHRKVSTSRWTPRLIGAASFVGGCLALLAVYDEPAVVVLGLLIAVGFLAALVPTSRARGHHPGLDGPVSAPPKPARLQDLPG